MRDYDVSGAVQGQVYSLPCSSAGTRHHVDTLGRSDSRLPSIGYRRDHVCTSPFDAGSPKVIRLGVNFLQASPVLGVQDSRKGDYGTDGLDASQSQSAHVRARRRSGTPESSDLSTLETCRSLEPPRQAKASNPRDRAGRLSPKTVPLWASFHGEDRYSGQSVRRASSSVSDSVLVLTWSSPESHKSSWKEV